VARGRPCLPTTEKRHTKTRPRGADAHGLHLLPLVRAGRPRGGCRLPGLRPAPDARGALAGALGAARQARRRLLRGHLEALTDAAVAELVEGFEGDLPATPRGCTPAKLLARARLAGGAGLGRGGSGRRKGRSHRPGRRAGSLDRPLGCRRRPAHLLPPVRAARALELLEQAPATREPGAPLFPESHLRAHRRAARKLGIAQRITLRDLRHCHATWSAQGTGDAAAAQAALGHTDLRTPQRYLSTTFARVACAALAVDQVLGEIPNRHTGPAHGAQNAEEAAPTIASETASTDVGATGFEPATTCSQSRRATRLRYAPSFP